MDETLDDLLNLFQLEMPITEEDIKLSKKKVLLLHPDKNRNVNNINEIFIKYNKSYKKLLMLYQYTNSKNSKKDINHEIDGTFKEYIKKNGYKDKDFTKHFNKMFESVYIKSEDEKKGYDEWLKSEEDIYYVDDIERSRKLIINSLVKTDELEYYSKSDNFSDLKTAHINSVIPIDCEKVMKNKQVFNNVNEYIIHRKNNESNIMSENNSKIFLQKQYKKDTEDSIKLAYQCKVQEDETNKRMKIYNSKFLILE